MTNRNSSNINIPEAREAMDKFKRKPTRYLPLDYLQTIFEYIFS